MDDVVGIWTSIIGKYSQAKDGTLKHEELIVFRVFSFICDVEINGVSGAFYNLSPKLGTDQHQWIDIRLVAEALVTIGDNETAQLLIKTAGVFENLPESLSATWGDFMEMAEAQLSDKFWDTIDARIRNVYDFLEVYTRSYLL